MNAHTLPVLSPPQPGESLPAHSFSAPCRSRLGCVTSESPVWTRSERGTVHPSLVVIGFAVMTIVLAAAFVLRTPLTQATRGGIEDGWPSIEERQRQAEYHALERAVGAQLKAATDGLQQLRQAAVPFQRRVDAALGLPLPTAADTPPAWLRKLILTSDAFLATWTTLVNTYVTREQLTDCSDCILEIRSRLRDEMLYDSDVPDLEQLNDWISARQYDIETSESLFQQLGQFLDAKPFAKTIETAERSY